MALGSGRGVTAPHPYAVRAVEVSLDLARLVSEHETLGEAVRALSAAEPEVLAYACTSGSFVGGIAGERAMCEAMFRSGERPSVTTSGALLEALAELGARRIALVTPYTRSVTESLEEYLAEAASPSRAAPSSA